MMGFSRGSSLRLPLVLSAIAFAPVILWVLPSLLVPGQIGISFSPTTIPATSSVDFYSPSVMRYFIPRTRMVACSFIQSRCNRALHVATGRFTALSAQGAPATREVEVWLGDPGESYVMFDPEISQYFQTGIIQQGGCSLTKDPELYPLIFHHSTRHFSHSMSAFETATLELTYVLKRCSLIPD